MAQTLKPPSLCHASHRTCTATGKRLHFAWIFQGANCNKTILRSSRQGPCVLRSVQRQVAAAAGPPADSTAAAPSTSKHNDTDWKGELIGAAIEGSSFVELHVRAKVPDAQPWHTVTARRVSLRGKAHLQVNTFTARQCTTANHLLGGPACRAALQQLLEQPGIGSVQLRSTDRDVTVQLSKRGKAVVHRSNPQQPSRRLVNVATLQPQQQEEQLQPLLQPHDKPKDTPIPSSGPHPFLQKIGLQTVDGRIRAHMQDKFSQLNELLKLMTHTGVLQQLAAEAAGQGAAGPGGQSPATGGRPLHVLDCGCGSSHLSFGTYHYLNNVLGLPAVLTGVDSNAGLMQRSNALCAELGLEGAHFFTETIGSHRPATRPDIVLALHACDTATDEALALAVKQGSPLILAVPCCHKQLQGQMAGRPPSARPPFQPLLRHGILKQRLMDLVTDSLRAELLRAVGYKTDVVEFISTEHTPRNLLIRAVKARPAFSSSSSSGGAGEGGESSISDPHGVGGHTPTAGEGRGRSSAAEAVAGKGGPAAGGGYSREQLHAASEYLQLRDYWGVRPHLEVLLQEEVGQLLRAVPVSESEPGMFDS